MQAFWKRWAPDNTPDGVRTVVLQRKGRLYTGNYFSESWCMRGLGSYVNPQPGDLWMYEEEIINNIPVEA